MDKMVAMQLNGAHIGRTIHFEYEKHEQKHPGSMGKVNITVPRKITKLIHWPSGDVTIGQAFDAPRYPYYAEVIFHD